MIDVERFKYYIFQQNTLSEGHTFPKGCFILKKYELLLQLWRFCR
ncbi:MAG: hypothetical protein RIS64_1843 [Bacteroidota bacterium]|jgi:hypothetical protein